MHCCHYVVWSASQGWCCTCCPWGWVKARGRALMGGAPPCTASGAVTAPLLSLLPSYRTPSTSTGHTLSHCPASSSLIGHALSYSHVSSTSTGHTLSHCQNFSITFHLPFTKVPCPMPTPPALPASGLSPRAPLSPGSPQPGLTFIIAASITTFHMPACYAISKI